MKLRFDRDYMQRVVRKFERDAAEFRRQLAQLERFAHPVHLAIPARRIGKTAEQEQLRRAVAAMGAQLPDFPVSPVIHLKAQADAQFVHQQGERRRVAGRAHAPGLVAKRLRLSQQRQRHAAKAALKGENQRKEEIAARVRFHLRQIYGRHEADMLLSVSHDADGTPPADSRHV